VTNSGLKLIITFVNQFQNTVCESVSRLTTSKWNTQLISHCSGISYRHNSRVFNALLLPLNSLPKKKKHCITSKFVGSEKQLNSFFRKKKIDALLSRR